jgi:ParB-like chromosome segregation protein Spo0J
VPYKGNARTHSKEQIAQIAASITEFGWTNPILIRPNNTLIAGEGRLEAAQKLGFSGNPSD